MKNKIIITSLCALFMGPAIANNMQMPPMGENGGGPRGAGMPMMQNLTAEQQTCLQNAMAQCGIEMPTPPARSEGTQTIQPRQ